MQRATTTLMSLTCLVGVSPALGSWVDYVNETSVRMPTPPNDPSTSTSDNQEKDYAWADVDLDGDVDLVVVRKVPFTSAGGKTNVLFMNEGIAEGHPVNGVLVDRTADYAVASDDGSSGFLDLTNDRDIVFTDVDDDGWLDMVTATTLSDGLPKTISHPRVYMNLGEQDGVWQGFRYEEDRIPQLYTVGGLAVAPRFCSVTAGDVTGDGIPDLYFGDYDSGVGAGQPPEWDLNNRLLVNDGNGVFTDETADRLTTTMANSAFGAASTIADINGDGANDVVKQTSLQSPTHVAITYNETAPGDIGFFSRDPGNYDTVYDAAPYFVSVGDLNGDGRLDLVIVDDGTDRYMLNNGNDGNGQAIWVERTFSSASSSGFGGNALISDLNNDGLNDVLITDVDVDISGCSRRMHIYRNLGGGFEVSLQEQLDGSSTVGIPTSMLQGTHDVAVFDINGDGWKDLVIGRCNSTEVWMNDPPQGMVFSYPLGLSSFVTPGQDYVFQVHVEAIGDGASTEPGSGRLHYAIGGGAFVDVAMASIGRDLYEATIPALACAERVEYYVTAELSSGAEYSDPAGAPSTTHVTIGASGTTITLRDEMEEDVSGWTVVNDPALLRGAWEQADPNGTLSGGTLASPEDDATAGAENTMAFVTENGVPSGGAGVADVDGGPTHLISPAFDLEGTEGIVSYARWFFTSEPDDPDAADSLDIAVSNDDGDTWALVESIDGTGSAWESATFVVGDYVMPTAAVRVRFTTSDQTSAPFSSIVEAGIDNFQVEEYECVTVSCRGDFDATGDVGFTDVLSVLSAWGACIGECPQDLDLSGDVGFADLLATLAAWGPCK